MSKRRSTAIAEGMKRMLLLALGGFLLLLSGCDEEESGNDASNHNTEFAALDDFVRQFIRKNKIPGGAIAVTQHGRLVHAKGFGLANPETEERFGADTPARVGSLSKLVTATAVLKLVEQGKLQLNSPVFGPDGLLPALEIPTDADPRVRQIVARDFLTMTSGWNPKEVGDTTVPTASLDYMIETGKRLPAHRDIAAGMLERELQFKPGTEYRYLNASPIFLSKMIARLTGLDYEEFVSRNLLHPVGLNAPRIGVTRLAERGLGEATYTNAPPAPSLYPGDALVPLSYSYGVVDVHLIGPTGGWVFSAVDIARFFAHAEGSRTSPFLTPASRAHFSQRPPGVKTWHDTSIFYGFHAENFDNGEFWGKYGSMPGVAAWVGHFSEDFSAAVILNGRDLSAPEVYHPEFAGTTFDEELRDGIRAELRKVKDTLEGDLFETRYQSDRPAWTGHALAVGKVGSRFQHRLTAIPEDAEFSMEENLPGVELDSSTGEMSGIPTQAGRYLVPVKISNSRGSAEALLEVQIGSAGSPVERGAAYCPKEMQFVLRDGRIVDEVVMQSAELLVQPRDGTGVRVLLVDADGDLVVAELEGAGRLKIRLPDNRMTTHPLSPAARIAQGNPEFELTGTDADSVFRYFALGKLNSPESAKGDAVADCSRLSCSGSSIDSLCLANARFSGESGSVGITAPQTTVRKTLLLGDMATSGTASPRLRFKEVDTVYLLGSRFQLKNGKPVQVSGLPVIDTFYGADADGKLRAPQVPEARFVEDGADITEQLFPK